jgi:four helix bundle protein
MGVGRFEDLEIWKRSVKLSIQIYKLLSSCKDYGFRDQITRSGLSIPSNIAEGFERSTSKEFVRFLDIARSSNGELRTQLYIGIEAGFIEKETGIDLISETRELSAMITGLKKTVNRKQRTQ